MMTHTRYMTCLLGAWVGYRLQPTVIMQYRKSIPVPRMLKEVKLTPAPRKASLRSGVQLPPLPMFGDAEGGDGDVLHHWVKKLHRYAKMERWTARETLLRFESRVVVQCPYD